MSVFFTLAHVCINCFYMKMKLMFRSVWLLSSLQKPWRISQTPGDGVGFESRTGFDSRESSQSEKQLLTVYDLDNKFIAYSATFDDVIDVVAEWGSFYILTRDGQMFVLQEKDTQTKLEVSPSVIQFIMNMFRLLVLKLFMPLQRDSIITGHLSSTRQRQHESSLAVITKIKRSKGILFWKVIASAHRKCELVSGTNCLQVAPLDV